MQCLRICNCRLCQRWLLIAACCTLLGRARFLLSLSISSSVVLCPSVARFLIIIYGNNCYFSVTTNNSGPTQSMRLATYTQLLAPHLLFSLLHFNFQNHKLVLYILIFGWLLLCYYDFSVLRKTMVAQLKARSAIAERKQSTRDNLNASANSHIQNGKRFTICVNGRLFRLIYRAA